MCSGWPPCSPCSWCTGTCRSLHGVLVLLDRPAELEDTVRDVGVVDLNLGLEIFVDVVQDAVQQLLAVVLCPTTEQGVLAPDGLLDGAGFDDAVLLEPLLD